MSRVSESCHGVSESCRRVSESCPIESESCPIVREWVKSLTYASRVGNSQKSILF